MEILLPFIVSWLIPALITSADPILLLVSLIFMLFCPSKPWLQIGFKIGVFFLLIALQYPSFLKAVRTAFSVQLQPSYLGSSFIGMLRERALNVAQLIRCWR